jgi:hypothetical protein
MRPIQRQSIADAPKDNCNSQSDEANAEKSRSQTPAKADQGNREQLVSMEILVHDWELSRSNARERPRKTFYLQIVGPLSHRDSRPEFRIICDEHPNAAVIQRPKHQTRKYRAKRTR